MGETIDLGRRIELLSSDRRCHNISIGLYERDVAGTPWLCAHTYAAVDGADQRVAFITDTLRVMMGLDDVADGPGWLTCPCGTSHLRAIKRGFLDLCKLETGAPLEPMPLTMHDKKAECDLSVVGKGGGVYEIQAAADTPAAQRRVKALARGFLKVCEMQSVEGSDTQVAFACKTNHDALMGLLFFRAMNVRSMMAEEEMAATRGVLSTPSQQE